MLLSGVGLVTVVLGTRLGVARHRLRLSWRGACSMAACSFRSPYRPYIVAYAYLDILHPVGPVQEHTALAAGI